MRQRRAKLGTLFLIGLGLGYSVLSSTVSGANAPQRPQRPRSTSKADTPPQRDYSKFTHRIETHQTCESCHKFPSSNWKQVRKADEAFPDVTDYPEHSACLVCHRQQFFTGASPSICSVCHLKASPRGGPRYPFANPREIFDASKKGQNSVSEFRVYFPHEKHEGVLGENRRDIDPGGRARLVAVLFSPNLFSRNANTHSGDQETKKTESCSKCHQFLQPQGESEDEFVKKPPKDLGESAFWLKKGTFETSPQSHASCFTCHSQDGGLSPAASDCGICHKLSPTEEAGGRRAARGDFDPITAGAMGITDKTTLDKWARREAVRFRHEWFSHAELACADCHSITGIDTISNKGPEVPVLSCGGSGSGCHITPTSDEGGALNTEIDQKGANAAFQCSKCHASLGKRPVPESHIKAIAAIKDKR